MRAVDQGRAASAHVDGSVVEVFPNDCDVVIVLADYAIPTGNESTLENHDEVMPVDAYQFGFALVVESSLLPARNAGHGRSPIEQRHGLGVLLLLELNHEMQRGPISVDGQSCGASSSWRYVAEKPAEARLTITGHAQDFVTEVKDIMLVALGTLRHSYSCRLISAAAMAGDEAVLKRNSDASCRFDTFRRSPSENCSIPTSLSYRNSRVRLSPVKIAR